MKVVLYKSGLYGPSDGVAETLVAYAIQLSVSHHTASVVMMYPSGDDQQYTSRLEAQGVPWKYLSTGKVAYGLKLLRAMALKVARTATLMSIGRAAAEHVSNRAAHRYSETFRNFLSSYKPDLVHVLGSAPGASIIIEAARQLNFPVLFQELGIPEDGPQWWAYHKRLNAALSGGSHVAALSPWLAQRCRESYPQVDDIVILPLIVEDLGHRRLLAPSVSDIVFGYSGRIETIKGVIDLARAFLKVHHQDPSSRLRVAGSGREEGSIVKILRKGGAIGQFEHAAPYTNGEGKRAFMHSLDVLVHPSYSEGTPNTIIEAMSAGLPIIACAVGGIPDVVSADCGILVPAGDPDALADAMGTLAADAALRHRMGAAGRKRFERLFSAKSATPLLLRRYRSVCAGRDKLTPTTADAINCHPWTVDDI